MSPWLVSIDFGQYFKVSQTSRFNFSSSLRKLLPLTNQVLFPPKPAAWHFTPVVMLDAVDMFVGQDFNIILAHLYDAIGNFLI